MDHTGLSLQFHAYLHVVEKSGRMHLRVRQNIYGSDTVKERMYHVGSPAYWNQDLLEWDYPLTPSAVIELDRVAKDVRAEIHWDPQLKEMADHSIALDAYEEQVRLSIERAIRNNEALPAYPTNTMGGTKPAMYHQSVSYHWALRTSGLLLSHEPGLGKTRSAADAGGGWYREQIIRPMRQVWRPTAKVGTTVGLWGIEGGILVVCPKVMMRTWRTELFQWQGMIGLEISGRQRARKVRAAGTLAHVHIINYEMLSLLIDMQNAYDAIIVDESHKCANRSQQTMNVLNLSLHAKRKLLLTGTPVTNDLKSVFFQMLICDGGRSLGPSESRFLERYFTSEQTRNGATNYTPREGAIEDVSAAMAKHTYFLKKTDVLDLPSKTHTPILLDMTADQARYYEQVRTEAISYIQDKEVTAEMAATRMMKLAQICQGFVLTDDGEARHFTNAKREALTSLLLDTYRHRKVVVWARFTYEIQMLCQMLHEAGVTYVKLAGDVKQGQRNSIIQAWQTRPDIKVFVGQLQLGIGITLHAAECEVPCSDTIYLGLDFSFINWKQTQDRIHRIGQRDACNYQYLLTENGIDHRMYRALLAKEETAEAVHKKGKDFYLSLLKDDTPALAAID